MIDAAHEYQLQVAQEGVRAVGDADMLKQCARIFTDNAREIHAGRRHDPPARLSERGGGSVLRGAG